MVTEENNTKTLSVEDIIAEVNRYCSEHNISLIRLCDEKELNPDLLYRMRRGGPANPTLSNINSMLLAIGKRLDIVDANENEAA